MRRGPASVGKSISLRRFLSTLDERRHHLVRFSYLPGTPVESTTAELDEAASSTHEDLEGTLLALQSAFA